MAGGFSIEGKLYQIMPAEVLEVIYKDDSPELIYGIKVKILADGSAAEDETSTSVITAVPINYNNIRMPLRGEVVLLFKAPSPYSSGNRINLEIYYIDIVSLQFMPHHNSIPTTTKITTTKGSQSGNSSNYAETSAGNTNSAGASTAPKVDSNFTEKPTVKPLQPYVGDVILSGRYGQTIRFSTESKGGEFAKTPNFSKEPGKPITIIRNTDMTKDTGKINDFVTEDFDKDDTYMVLASGQELVLTQASKTLKASKGKNITSWKDEKWGKTPQALISSGRIVFNSTQKEIIAFAKKGIALSTDTVITIDAKESVVVNANKIELGLDADEPLMLGNAWKTWMDQLLTAIGTISPVSPVGPCSPLTATPQWAQIEQAKAKLKTLISDTVFTKKKTSA
jgi:hypothetical protein